MSLSLFVGYFFFVLHGDSVQFHINIYSKHKYKYILENVV